jgi:hypothetical protein
VFIGPWITSNGFIGLVSIGSIVVRTQGFKHLLKSIMMHVLETSVDILVRGAWLRTSTAHDVKRRTRTHTHTHVVHCTSYWAASVN